MPEPELYWVCRHCGSRIKAAEFSCSVCGYQRTEYDKARLMNPGVDTGSFIVSRLSQPSFSELQPTGSRRIVWAFAIGTITVLLLGIVGFFIWKH